MLLLASTSDQIRVVSTSTSALDVQACGMDMNPSNSDRPTGFRQNTIITTATTTTVCNSPASGVLRTVKTLSIRNRGAATQTVTVQHTDGTTTVEVIRASLLPNTSLQYQEGAGWWVTDTQGRAVVSNMPNAGAPVVDQDTIVLLSSDVVNNNGTANTMQDVTGLSFSVLTGKLYWFEFHIVYTSAATTTGSRWSINGPSSPTYLDYMSEYSLTSTTTTRNALLQAYDSPSASNATSATTGNNWAWIQGVIQPSSDGTVIARFASEVASSAITAKAGSFVRYRQITP
jgi:hypothetical protein